MFILAAPADVLSHCKDARTLYTPDSSIFILAEGKEHVTPEAEISAVLYTKDTT
jgi:hypothetical protein